MSAFVGRTRELELLRARFRQAVEGRGSTVFVTGEAGAGKSTLVEQFLLEVATGAERAKVIDAACSEQFGTAEPLVAFVEAFKELLQAGGRDGGGMSWLDVAKEVAPTWISALPVVGNVLEAGVVTAMAVRKREGGGGTAVAQQKAVSEEALFFQYTEVLLRAAEEQPVVLFLDDLHWADQASVSLLAHIARKIGGSRVLLLGTFRPVDVEASDHALRKAKQELERYSLSEEIALSSLDSTSLAELLRDRLGGEPTRQLAAWMERNGGSNPLFYGELLTWLVDGGYAAAREDVWDLERTPDEVEIPRSAESALERRLERLDPDTYRVLEYASVEGNLFHSVSLARLLEMDELALEEALEPIARTHRLIRLVETRDLPNGEIASVYAFSHSLIQDVLHRNIQGKRRILLHRKVAEILVELYGNDTTSVNGELAVHFDEGRQPERAFEFSMLAADRAELLYAHLDAREMLLRALRNAKQPGDRRRALERLGSTSRLVGRFDDALAHFGEALSEAEKDGNATAALGVRRMRLEVELERGSRPASELLEDLKGLIRATREEKAQADLCRLLWMLRRMPASVSATPGTFAALNRALEVARAAGDDGMRARAKYEIAAWLIDQARSEEAVPHLEGALAVCTEDDRQRAGSCHNALGVCHLLAARIDAAVDEFDAARKAFAEVGDPANTLYVDSNLGGMLTRTGDWQRAEAYLGEAFRIARRLASANRLLFPLFQLAEHWEARADWERSASCWSQLREAALETGFVEDAIAAECGLGMAALETGEIAEARRRLDSVTARLGASPVWSETTEVWHRLAARVKMAEGDHDGSLRHIEVAERELESRDRFAWARFRLLRAALLVDAEPAAARASASEALAAFREQGARPMAERAQAMLDSLEGAT
ncbi:MAG: AAA family ATPase [Gemmatimonadota bacterium]